MGRDKGRFFLNICQRECGLADTPFLDFRHPELKENGFRCFRSSGLWRFVMAALGN